MKTLLLSMMLCCAAYAYQTDFNHDGRVDNADLRDFELVWRQEYGLMSRNCAYFEVGTSNYTTVPDNNAIDVGTGDFSICFWINPAELPTTASRYILDKYTSAGFVGYAVFVDPPTANPRATLSASSDGATFYNTEVASDLVVGTWCHIAFSYDADGNCTPYYNGVAGTPVDVSAVGDISSTSDLYINYAGLGVDGTFGYFDDLRIYKKALTEQEVANIYNDGFGSIVNDEMFPVGIDGFFMNFDAAFSGTTVYGTKVVSGVSSALNGTITGGVTQVAGGVPFHAINLTDNFESYTRYINQSGKKIQFRFRNAGGKLQVSGYKPLTPKMTDNR